MLSQSFNQHRNHDSFNSLSSTNWKVLRDQKKVIKKKIQMKPNKMKTAEEIDINIIPHKI